MLINPPYGEASNPGEESKAGIAKTKMGANMEEYGKANKELFTQFVARISRELPNATLAMFSKLKYVNAPNFEDFRKIWDSDYLG